MTHRTPLNFPQQRQFRVGKLEITPLWDGVMVLPYEGFWPDAAPEELQSLVEAYGLAKAEMALDLNVLLMRREGELWLVDVGMGPTIPWFGPDMGRLPEALARVGVSPDQIDHILLTHLHPDHCGGLIDAQGQAVFPRAKVYASTADAAEWLDEAQTKAEGHIGLWAEAALAAIAPYRSRLQLFEAGDEIAEGISTQLIAGHALGMVAYVFSSEGQSLAVTGDLAHHPVMDLRHPEWVFHRGFDANPEAGAEAKVSFLNHCAEEGILLHAYHFAYPGVGRIRAREDGIGYDYAPL